MKPLSLSGPGFTACDSYLAPPTCDNCCFSTAVQNRLHNRLRLLLPRVPTRKRASKRATQLYRQLSTGPARYRKRPVRIRCTCANEKQNYLRFTKKTFRNAINTPNRVDGISENPAVAGLRGQFSLIYTRLRTCKRQYLSGIYEDRNHLRRISSK